jgi:hypothetical protein
MRARGARRVDENTQGIGEEGREVASEQTTPQKRAATKANAKKGGK